MKNIVLTTFLIFFMVFILPAILALGIRNIPDRYQPSLDRVQQIYSDITLSQSFISTSDNLSSIGLSIKNPNLENKKDIFLSIYDKDNNLVGKTSLNGSSIPDGDFIKFKFPPIKDSKNKLLTFNLSSPTSDKLNALEIFLTKENINGVDDLKIAPIIIDQEEASMSASFVPFYKTVSFFAQILGIYSDWSKRFFEDRIFATAYLLLIASITIILLSKWKLPRLKK